MRWIGVCAIVLAGCAPRFETPRPERPIRLPADQGVHLEFPTEWWYWNGHLSDQGGHQYDFFLSFTRRDLRGDRFHGFPILSPGQSYLALFAILDRQTGAYDACAKVNAPDLWAAGADEARPFLWHDTWSAQWADGAFYLTAHVGPRTVHLQMRPEKPVALYGKSGFVDVPGNPQYVYSYTRMATDGALVDGDASARVHGVSWFDHFIGNVQSQRFRAWDWMSLQLDDGYEYMIGQLRDDRGQTVPYANFEVGPGGRVATLAQGEPRWTLRRRWKSPESGETYRLGWTIEASGLQLEVSPVADDQEFEHVPVSRFWEGAIRVTGTHGGRPVHGEGFLETVAEGGLPVGEVEFAR